MHLLLRYGASSDVFFSSKPLDPLFGDGQDPSDIPERSDVYTEHNEDAVLRGREKLKFGIPVLVGSVGLEV
ncbi:hypothetical protein PgNI_10318 [Pyricularia grisea]|uniref:Uncharacterized protein n=1 Tax=Pyricularia grisea TaxID=148305 RepID=A0A6P8AZH4_PYRGI|nr:hypothetical protein PgNI_10318 [Pyricularia grisea]TLD07793.1 hypothetical protein PgNI_10318 [Pyricularia grisea]